MGASKHAGVVAKVSEHFIRTGLLPAHVGRALNQAFDLRLRADYREFFQPTAQQADRVIERASEFLGAARRILTSETQEGR